MSSRSMASLRLLVSALNALIPENPFRLRGQSHLLVQSAKIHCDREGKGEAAVNSICDSFRRGWNWDHLTREYKSLELDDSLVEKVLLELKEPIDAKRALGFFHWSAKSKNFEHGVPTYCITVLILVRAKLVRDARALLDSLLRKSEGNPSKLSVLDLLLRYYKITASTPFVFDLLVQAYAQLRMFELAFSVCCRLVEEHGFSLSLSTFNKLIHVVEKSEESCMVWKIYEFMIDKGTNPNDETVRSMISALCKQGKLQEVVDTLGRIYGKRCSPHVIVNSTLILRILEEGRIGDGIRLLKRMLRKNMVLDTIAYSLIVYARLKLGNLESAREVYEEMLRRGFVGNSFIYTLFIGAHCGKGEIEEAESLIREMDELGLKAYDETFNLVVEGCAKAGRVEESIRNLEDMVARGLIPSCSAFNVMVRKACEEGEVKEVDGLLTMLLDRGFVPDEMTYSHLIQGYAKRGEVQAAVKLYYEMESRLLSPGESVFSCLIDCFCQSGKTEEADKYFKIMKNKVGYTTGGRKNEGCREHEKTPERQMGNTDL